MTLIMTLIIIIIIIIIIRLMPKGINILGLYCPSLPPSLGMVVSKVTFWPYRAWWCQISQNQNFGLLFQNWSLDFNSCNHKRCVCVGGGGGLNKLFQFEKRGNMYYQATMC